jgi:hypothetical protein
MKLSARVAALVILIPCAASCTSAAKPEVQHAQQAIQASRIAPGALSDAPCDPTRDREAILAMSGTFEVSFAFDEIEALTPDYKLADPYHTEALEVVTPLVTSDRQIVLQHVLLLRKYSGAKPSGEYKAMKHWRQDWTFEDTELAEFHGQRLWEQRALSPAQAHCTWSQAVFEVDDGPRYESYGRFVHTGQGALARSVWTSQATWRPLPRREYTHRHDYDVLLGINRHVITASGWQHEQDNVKYVLEDQHSLAREHGLNQYKRIQLGDAAVAQRYLEQTGAFWADVRAEWSSLLTRSPRVLVHQELSGKPLYELLFPMAEHADAAAPDSARQLQRAQIHAAIANYVEAKQQPLTAAR